MKKYIYSLMTDKRDDFIAKLFKFILYLASLIYALAIYLRALFYKFGIFKAEKANLKVISVGNITLGGTGKTPFVIMLAKIFAEEMKKNVCVLIRGYGWDEQAMLKKNLPDIPVLVGENRARSCRRAIRLYGSDTALLDDGFQHWELERDLNIVLIDSRNPFGNGSLFPRGILREPKESIKRADIVVFTKVPKTGNDINKLKEELKAINEKLVFAEARHEPEHFYNPRKKDIVGLDSVKGKRVILISSIGDPAYFEDTIKGLSADIAEHIIFPDHHDYRAKDIDKIKAICGERKFDYLVTTEKDAIKLNRMGFFLGEYILLILVVEMAIIKGKEELIAGLHSVYPY